MPIEYSDNMVRKTHATTVGDIKNMLAGLEEQYGITDDTVVLVLYTPDGVKMTEYPIAGAGFDENNREVAFLITPTATLDF